MMPMTTSNSTRVNADRRDTVVDEQEIIVGGSLIDPREPLQKTNRLPGRQIVYDSGAEVLPRFLVYASIF
jgi:hypothetical protein